MKRTYIFPEEGTFYKANLHNHTICSDGVLTPEQSKEVYWANGYDIVAFTDHDNYFYHGQLTDEHFLALGGYELGFEQAGDFGQVERVCHLCAIAKDPVNCDPLRYQETFMSDSGEKTFRCDRYDLDTIQHAIDELNQRGFLVTLNHPVWSNMPMEDVMALDGLHALEVFNSDTAYAERHDCGDAAYYEHRLRNGRPIGAVMADDNHHGVVHADGTVSRGPETARAWTMIKASSLQYEAVVRAFASGCYYASRGPEIKSLYIEDDKLVLDCSPIKATFLCSKYITAWQIHEEQGNLFTHAEFDLSELKEQTPFVWLKLLDEGDKDAVTNPIHFD